MHTLSSTIIERKEDISSKFSGEIFNDNNNTLNQSS